MRGVFLVASSMCVNKWAGFGTAERREDKLHRMFSLTEAESQLLSILQRKVLKGKYLTIFFFFNPLEYKAVTQIVSRSILWHYRTFSCRHMLSRVTEHSVRSPFPLLKNNIWNKQTSHERSDAFYRLIFFRPHIKRRKQVSVFHFSEAPLSDAKNT